MADPRLRIRLPAAGDPFDAFTVSAGRKSSALQPYIDVLPAKEWSITDDVLKVSDAASFSVANVDGENNGKFYIGMRVEIDASDDNVAGGQWTRVYTGRVTALEYSSDISGGSVIRVDCMDLGWHLTSCCGRPLQSTNGIKLVQLLTRLIDPTWGFKASAGAPQVTIGNVLNRTLKQGRQGVTRALPHNPEDVLPPIQVEPGQTPWQILEEYFKREGFLLNVGAEGDVIVFRPDYFQPSFYDSIECHGSGDGNRNKNNVVGRPSLRLTIDGVYSECQCWSTVVAPTEAEASAIAQSPNAQYRHASYKPASNPLPFYRLQVAVDGEAITPTMRAMRATYAFQLGQFQSWTYDCTVAGHSSRPKGSSIGAFWASDTMVPVNDTVNGGVSGMFYVQAVQRSMTLGEGPRSKLMLRQPILDPSLQAQLGGGAKKAAQPAKVVP